MKPITRGSKILIVLGILVMVACFTIIFKFSETILFTFQGQTPTFRAPMANWAVQAPFLTALFYSAPFAIAMFFTFAIPKFRKDAKPILAVGLIINTLVLVHLTMILFLTLLATE